MPHTHTHLCRMLSDRSILQAGMGAVVAGAGVRFHREVWFKRRGLLGVLEWSRVECRGERGLWRCKWRSVVRCCAADVFGKLRARAALRAGVCMRLCVRVNWPMVCYYSHMYLCMICTILKWHNSSHYVSVVKFNSN